MSLMMRLSDEEIALIEQKRAEEKAKQDELLKSYDHYKQGRTSQFIKTNSLRETAEETRKKLYQTIYDDLVSVSKDFTFVCEKVESKAELPLYEIDDNGSEIRYGQNEEGETIWYNPKETIKLPTYSYRLSIKYTGRMPENHRYEVVPVDKTSKYSGRVIGYKMQVRGTGIDSWGKSGQMTKASSVYKKILDTIEGAFRQIEYRTAQDQRNDRIKERFKVEFSKFEKNVISIHESIFQIKLDNGITLNINGYEDSNGNIRFNKDKISFPYNMDALYLIGMLNEIKGEQ